MADGVLANNELERLSRDVAKLIAEGKAEAEAAVGHALAVTYFRVGRRILRAGLTERAGYGESVLERLAEGLALDVRTLRHAVTFAATYEKAPPPGLSWSHYRELLGVRSAPERQWYERQALSAGWSKRQLIEAIRANAFAEADGGAGAEGGGGKGGVLPRPRAAMHVYEAKVERVIDGDTLLLQVDLGFEVTKVQRLRLASVDAPPLASAEGKAAQRFVVDRLARSAVVVVKTDKLDLYGRYVGHVMYASRQMAAPDVFVRGRYLNQEVVDGGYARVV